MRGLPPISVAAVMCLLAACMWGCSGSTDRRVVERPVVSFATTGSISIDRVELTDSATILYFSAHYRPGWWIRIAPDSYLRADGKEYSITDTCGFCPGRPIIMDDRGTHNFAITFEPIPTDASTFDFIEGHNTIEGFDLFGIDLTGTVDPFATPTIPDAGPRQEQLPPINLDGGSARINIRMLNWNPNLMTYVALNTSGYATAMLDSEGKATIDLPLKFPERVQASSGPSAYYGSFVTMPGDTVTLYLDALAGSDRAQGNAAPQRRLWAHGAYTDLNEYLDTDTVFGHIYDSLFAPLFINYRQSGDELAEGLLKAHAKARAEIDGLPLGRMERSIAGARIDLALLLAAKDYREMFGIEYENRHLGRLLPFDSIATTLSAEHFGKIGAAADADNPMLLLLDSWNRGLYDGTYSGPELYSSLSAFRLALKKANAGNLEPADTAAIKQRHLTDICRRIDHDIRARLKTMPRPRIERTPDVPAENIVEAIVARHPGKVVVISFWNPHNYVSLNPADRLDNDDIVTVNITDNSHPLPSIYRSMNILSGLHYLVSEEQSLALWRKYRIDRYPFYVIADRKGELYFGPDLRNYNWMTLKINERL